MDYIHIDFYIETDVLTSHHMVKKFFLLLGKFNILDISKINATIHRMYLI